MSFADAGEPSLLGAVSLEQALMAVDPANPNISHTDPKRTFRRYVFGTSTTCESFRKTAISTCRPYRRKNRGINPGPAASEEVS